MFKLQPNPTFKAKVPITIPGQAAPALVVMEFKHYTRDGVKGYFENLPGKHDAEVLADIVVGWTDVEEAFSREALARLLDNYPSAATAIFETFRNELFKAREKN